MYRSRILAVVGLTATALATALAITTTPALATGGESQTTTTAVTTPAATTPPAAPPATAPPAASPHAIVCTGNPACQPPLLFCHPGAPCYPHPTPSIGGRCTAGGIIITISGRPCSCDKPQPTATTSVWVTTTAVVAGTSTSPGTAAASGSLPVTGSRLPLIGGLAILLIAAGIGLFVIARRRQVRFTA